MKVFINPRSEYLFTSNNDIGKELDFYTNIEDKRKFVKKSNPLLYAFGYVLEPLKPWLKYGEE